MKVFYKNSNIIFFSILILLINHGYSFGQTLCNKPNFQGTKTISNIRFLKEDSKFQTEIYKNNSNSQNADITTGQTLNYNPSSPITYMLEVVAPKGSNVGMYIDYDNNGRPDIFIALFQGKANYYTDFELKSKTLIASNIKIHIVNSFSALNLNTFCGARFNDGEIETYVFKTAQCANFNIKQINAGLNDTICAGSKINLNGFIPGVVTGDRILWTASNYTLINPTQLTHAISLNASSNFTLNYKVASTGCEYASTKTVLVDYIPQNVKLQASASRGVLDSICLGDNLNLNLISVPATSLNFQLKNSQGNLIGNNTSTTTFTIDKPAIYLVEVSHPKMKACNANLFSNTNTVTVTQKYTPKVEIISTSSCASSAQFTARTTPASLPVKSYDWMYDYGINSFDNASGSTNSSQFKPANAGRYMLKVMNALNYCTSQSEVITINPMPATPGIIAIKPVCKGTTVTLSIVGTPDPSVTYEWYNNVSLPPIGTGITFNTSIAGNYYVRARKNITSCQSVFSKLVTVSFLPNTDLQLKPSGTILQCKAAAENISITNTAIDTKTINWYLDKVGSQPESKNISYSSVSGFEGNIIVTATDFNGCFAIDTVTIKIASNQKPQLFTKGTLCSGNTATLYTNITNGIKYEWKNSKGVIVNQSNLPYQLSINQSEKYSVSIDFKGSPNACTISSDPLTVDFLQTPQMLSTVRVLGDEYLCKTKPTTTLSLANVPIGTFTYQWYKNNVPVVGAVNATLLASDTGFYAVAFNNKGCFSQKCSTLTVANARFTKPEIYIETPCLGNAYSFGFSNAPPAAGAVVKWLLNNQVIPNAQVNHTPQVAGNYTMSYLQDGCESPISNTIRIYAPPNVSAGSDITVCHYTNTVSRNAISTSANTSIAWLPNNIADTAKNKSILKFNPYTLGENIITVYALDTLSWCSASDTLVVNVITNTLKQPTVISTSPKCDGGLGTSVATIIGGKAPFIYNWVIYDENFKEVDTIKSAKNIANIKAGTYYDFYVLDSDGCSQSKSENGIASAKVSSIKINSSIIQPNCKGDASGSVLLAITNTAGTVNYQWNDNANSQTQNVSNLAAGKYTVEISDDSGCAASTFQLVDPIPMTAGTILATQSSVITGNAAAVISSQVGAESTSNIKLQWQKNDMANTPTSGWTDIANENKNYIEPGILTKTTAFRRAAKDTCGTIYSNVATITVQAAVKSDSAHISGGGVLGNAMINIALYGTAPWKVVVKTNYLVEIPGDGFSTLTRYDTLPQIINNSYSYLAKIAGDYTIFSVNGKLVKDNGVATVFVPDPTIVTAHMTGGGVLGSTITVKFSGNLQYPISYTYWYSTRSDFDDFEAIKVDGISSSQYMFTPKKIGYYKGALVSDKFEKKGKVLGSVRISKNNDTIPLPTGDISGGGILGSEIIITINSNGWPAPWNVTMRIDYDSSGQNIILFENLSLTESPYSFPSKRVGAYRIVSVNNNFDGNGVAIVVIEDKDSSEVFVWNAVSPNGDMKNDNFVIEIPTRLQDKSAKIIIYDREGTRLVDKTIEINNLLNLNSSQDMYEYKWDCKNASGELLNPGTYFFSFVVKGMEKDKKASKAGYIELRR